MARIMNAFSGVRAHPQPVPMLAQGPVCWSVGWEEQTTPLEGMEHLNKNIMMQAPGSTLKIILLFYVWASRQ